MPSSDALRRAVRRTSAKHAKVDLAIVQSLALSSPPPAHSELSFPRLRMTPLADHKPWRSTTPSEVFVSLGPALQRSQREASQPLSTDPFPDSSIALLASSPFTFPSHHVTLTRGSTKSLTLISITRFANSLCRTSPTAVPRSQGHTHMRCRKTLISHTSFEVRRNPTSYNSTGPPWPQRGNPPHSP